MTRVVLLGSGGYHPTEERHTACVLLPESGIVLDAGTGFFRVRELLRTPTLDILLTHAHLDHACGLTYLLDVLWGKSVDSVRVHARPSDLEVVARRLFGSPLFPIPFEYELVPIDGAFAIGPWRVALRHQVHPGGSLGFHLEGPGGKLAYVTDTTADPEDAAQVDFVASVDLLIHECYFPNGQENLARRSGHSTVGAVAQLAVRAGVRQLVLVHANPLAPAAELAALEAAAREHFPATLLGTDRLELTLKGQ